MKIKAIFIKGTFFFSIFFSLFPFKKEQLHNWSCKLLLMLSEDVLQPHSGLKDTLYIMVQ